eukprot:GDKI01014313.1.p1 GENE.GDKI01014313.1~~GDKI01014313.1.p1  ORF type:complete len:192 (+),score=69.36 GDKI01014313.1:32-577(+)
MPNSAAPTPIALNTHNTPKGFGSVGATPSTPLVHKHTPLGPPTTGVDAHRALTSLGIPCSVHLTEGKPLERVLLIGKDNRTLHIASDVHPTFGCVSDATRIDLQLSDILVAEIGTRSSVITKGLLSHMHTHDDAHTVDRPATRCMVLKFPQGNVCFEFQSAETAVAVLEAVGRAAACPVSW